MPGELTQYAGRTLDFLNVIEKTLKSAVHEADLIHAMTVSVTREAAAVAASVHKSTEFDPTGRVGELLEKASAAVGRCHQESIGYRDSAAADPDLFEDDGVVECFEALALAFDELYDAVEHLREAVELHDAIRSPVIGSFENVEELIAALKS